MSESPNLYDRLGEAADTLAHAAKRIASIAKAGALFVPEQVVMDVERIAGHAHGVANQVEGSNPKNS